MNNKINLLFIIFILSSICYSQLFELRHNGSWRDYWVDYPSDATEPSPLVISMHGFSQTFITQIVQSEMSDFAAPQNIAVVYPEGLNFWGVGAWNAGVWWSNSWFDDVGYLDAMIDSIISNFSIDTNRIYACGFSNGGFMAYDLACELPERIVAFGSVSGNFMLNSNQDCTSEREIPIMHIHGTSDFVVSYYPPTIDASLTPNESIDFWVAENNFTEESYEQLNDNVHFYTFSSLTSTAEFVHIKVDGGPHEWFGYEWGFHASEELLNFFMQYSMTDFYEQSDSHISLSPELNFIEIPSGGGSFHYEAHLMNASQNAESYTALLYADLPNGLRYGPIGPTPANVQLAPGQDLNVNLTQQVPGAAPAGEYNFYCLLIQDQMVVDSSGFIFTKEAPSLVGSTSTEEEWIVYYKEHGIKANSNDVWSHEGLYRSDGTLISAMDVLGMEDIQVPGSFTLHQNYPNPFNPITTLRYDLPEDSFVKVTVYDMLGNVINNLVNDNQNSGHRSVQWNATNNQGQPVSAGVYIYSIEAGDFRQEKRMILLK